MEKKPSSVLARDFLVRQVAKDMGVDEELLEKIVRHQFDGVVTATQRNATIEMSGFGKFVWKEKAAQRKLDKMDKQVRALREKIARSDNQARIEQMTNTIDEMLLKRQVLINRMYEINRDLRGMEKQASSKGGAEGED